MRLEYCSCSGLSLINSSYLGSDSCPIVHLEFLCVIALANNSYFGNLAMYFNKTVKVFRFLKMAYHILTMVSHIKTKVSHMETLVSHIVTMVFRKEIVIFSNLMKPASDTMAT
jgi:hypothetical protein